MHRHLFLLGSVVTLAHSMALVARNPCGEGPDRVCYGVSGGESQNLDIEDIKYVADYLRCLGSNELLGCGKNGGQFGAKGNMSNPLYSTDDYKKTVATPDGVIIKLVKAPPPSS